MEQWKESLLTALSERFDAAFRELSENNPGIQAAVKEQQAAASQMQQHPEYGDAIKEIADTYFGAVLLLQSEYNQHLYIQGAKDCVAVLRELGVIK